MKGPFQQNFDAILQEINLKRQMYHKGALVGNDVSKILQSDNIRKIVEVFKPIQVNLKHGEKKVFSEHKIMSKVSTLLENCLFVSSFTHQVSLSVVMK